MTNKRNYLCMGLNSNRLGFNNRVCVRILKGLVTYLPFIKSPIEKHTGGTDTARYCYSVWLRHLVIAYAKGLLRKKVRVIAELGPGDSIGAGIAALISGVETYYAFDIVKYANVEKNLKIFDELVLLFRKRADIPDNNEFPNLKPYLESYRFPKHILTNNKMAKLLNNERLEKIKDAITNMEKPHITNRIVIRYFVPWDDVSLIKKSSVDMIFSQAVMEHVDNLPDVYRNMYTWLEKDGFISHNIDFKSHGFAKEWNGHWLYSDIVWKLIRGRRPYLINRAPLSVHLNNIKSSGFRLVNETRVKASNNINRKRLAGRFKNLSNQDLTTCGVFIQAIKK